MITISISSPRVFQVAGVPAIQVPAGAKEVRVAGEIAYVVGNKVIFKVGSAIGRCGRGEPHKTHYRRVNGHSPVSESIAVNRRGSAASIVIEMQPGYEFEARGYSRNAEWQHFRFDGNTVVRV
jgi:hypothetical protein